MSGLGHARRLARIDVVRMVRKRAALDGGVISAISAVLYGLLIVGLTLLCGYLARLLGRALIGGGLPVEPATAAEFARGGLGVTVVLAAVVIGIRAVGQRGTLTNADGILTVVPVREAVGGLLLAEWVYALIWTVPPAVGAGVGLALGAGTAWTVLTVPLAATLLSAAATALAYGAGLAVRHVVTRIPFVARNRVLAIGVVFLVYMAAVVTGSLNRAIAALFDPLAASPLGWYGDLALAGVPGVATDPARAAGALAVTGVVVAAGAAAAVRVAGTHWFADPVVDETEAVATESADDRVSRAVERVLDRPTAALVVLAWRRAARTPLKLLYAAYPAFFLIGIVVEIVQTGEVPVFLAYLLLAAVTWSAGVLFTLNPLGDQGAVLSTTLLSAVTGRRFVGAHLFAGLVVAVPLGTALVAGAGLLSPLPPARAGLLAALTPPVMVAGAALSAGIGSAFPRFEAATALRSLEAVVPSRLAFVLFTAHVVATTVAVSAVASPLIREVVAGLLSVLLPVAVAPGPVRPGAAVALVVLLAAPVAGYRYAVRRFERYTL